MSIFLSQKKEENSGDKDGKVKKRLRMGKVPENYMQRMNKRV